VISLLPAATNALPEDGSQSGLESHIPWRSVRHWGITIFGPYEPAKREMFAELSKGGSSSERGQRWRLAADIDEYSTLFFDLC
jgi:hypothetical protein